MKPKIKDIQIVPVREKEGLVAFASLVFEDSFYLGNIGIRTRPQGGFRLNFPTRLIGRSHLPIFHPINKKAYDLIESAVIAKFEELLAK
jgi:DNA-binding cell septation regulator SpoVG